MKFEIHQPSSISKGDTAMRTSVVKSISRFAPLLLTVSLLPLLAACQDQANSAVAKPERPVQVQRVAYQPDEASREFVGVVRATKPISASASPARSSPASSTSATRCGSGR
jgi:hypothetical protein